LGKEPESARQEFWIAIVGPLTSIAIAGLLAIGYFVLSEVYEGAAAVSANLAFINLAIGVFNLVHGFPLDGGRVLRAAPSGPGAGICWTPHVGPRGSAKALLT